MPPGFVIRAAITARRMILRMADALIPADVALLERATGTAHTQLLGAAARYRIADLLAEGPLGCDELAARIGTEPDATHRMMRALATAGVFAMDADGRCRNNRLSAALRENRLSAVRAFAEYFASRSNSEAWTDFDRTLRTGKGAFPRVHGMSV